MPIPVLSLQTCAQLQRVGDAKRTSWDKCTFSVYRKKNLNLSSVVTLWWMADMLLLRLNNREFYINLQSSTIYIFQSHTLAQTKNALARALIANNLSTDQHKVKTLSLNTLNTFCI